MNQKRRGKESIKKKRHFLERPMRIISVILLGVKRPGRKPEGREIRP